MQMEGGGVEVLPELIKKRRTHSHFLCHLFYIYCAFWLFYLFIHSLCIVFFWVLSVGSPSLSSCYHKMIQTVSLISRSQITPV